METVNITEKEVAETFQIPLKALKRCRNEKKFGIKQNFVIYIIIEGTPDKRPSIRKPEVVGKTHYESY